MYALRVVKKEIKEISYTGNNLKKLKEFASSDKYYFRVYFGTKHVVLSSVEEKLEFLKQCNNENGVLYISFLAISRNFTT